MSGVHITWDDAKRRANLSRHGFDFADAAGVLAGVTLTMEDRRFDYPERRYVSLGLLQDTVVTIVHTDEPRETRIISMRKATRHEQALYFQGIAGG